MSRIPGLRRLMRIVRNDTGVARAVDDELHFHLEMTMRELIDAGMSPDDARREAGRRFGDVQRTRERLTDLDRALLGQERRVERWNAFVQDLRYAVRGIRQKPGFAAAVVVTLGLGIGANAAMFRIVDRLLFRPPAYLASPNLAGRIYFEQTFRDKRAANTYTGYRRYLDLRENTTSFDAMAPFTVNSLAVGEGTDTHEMNLGVTGADFWKLFDVRPVRGRFFTAQEDRPPYGAHVVVLSYAFWQTRFGGRDPLGQQLHIGPAKYTIIGVAPERFTGFSSAPVIGFIPMTAQMGDANPDLKHPWYDTYYMSWFEIFARRNSTVTLAAANADLTRAQQLSFKKQATISKNLSSFDIARPSAFIGPVLLNRGPNEGKEAKVATWLLGVAGIVLLIACANVANLLLARALKRRREIAVRVALGISRWRLFAQLLTESLLLAALAAVAALAIAQWGGDAMRRVLLDETAPGPTAFADSRILIVVAALAVLTGVFCGLAPVLQATREDVASALKAGSREGTVHRSRLRAGLLVAQAALSVLLLVGAGLFLRSLANANGVRLGYDADRLLWVDLNARGTKLDSAQQREIRQSLLERAARLPGVEGAARVVSVPFWMTWEEDLRVAGIDSVSKLGDFTLQAVTPGYFSTSGTRILRGRGITEEDHAGAPHVMVVDESMAAKLWPNQSALGKCVRLNADTAPCNTVVGVAEDIRGSDIGKRDMHYYLSIAQFHPETGGLFVRTSAPAADHAEAIRRGLQPLMPGASYVTVTPLSQVIAGETRSWKIGATMFAVFGVLALVIAAIGLYSVIAYNVAQRTHEMGVRVALGAQARNVVGLVVREGLVIVLPGVALGAAIALVASHWLQPLLFQTSAKDPPTMVGVAVTLILVAVLASWIPALRAARVDPSVALRAD